MANTLQIKRGVWNTTGAPSSLSYGEIAWDNASEVLYIGKQTDAGGTITVRSLNDVVISDIPDATTSVKGLASFSSSNFDVTSGAVTIKDSGVATAEIQDAAITTAKINDSAVSTAKIANDAVTLGTKTTGNYVSSITGGTGITNLSAASEGASHTLSVNLDELTTVTSVGLNDYIVAVDFQSGNTEKMQLQTIQSQLFSDVSGDITIASNGDAAISAGVIVTADIADDQITAAKLAHNLTLPGDITVSGNLTVQGDTTTLNTSTLDVEDLNITVAKGAASAADADGAGLTVDGPATDATLLYRSTGDKWVVNKAFEASAGFVNTTFDGGTY
jgi:hypothetical protein